MKKATLEQEDTFLQLQAKSVTKRYLDKIQKLLLIRQLFPLITAIQKHRGLSLAFKEGDITFAREKAQVNLEVSKRLQSLSILTESDSSSSVFISSEILPVWKEISSWKGNLMDEFNLHSHLVDILMRHLTTYVEQLGFYLSLNSLENRADKEIDCFVLVHLLFKDNPELMEKLAQLRGLATHITVLKHCDHQHKIRIEALLKDLSFLKEKFREHSNFIHRYLARDIPSLMTFQVQETQMVKLINYIKECVLIDNLVDADGHYIFTVGSKLIDTQVQIVNEGLNYIHDSIYQGFQQWHEEPL